MRPQKPMTAQQGLERIYDALESEFADEKEIDSILRNAGLDPDAVGKRLRNLAEATKARNRSSLREKALSWFDSFLEEASWLLSSGQAIAVSRSLSGPDEDSPGTTQVLREDHRQALFLVFDGQYDRAERLFGELIQSSDESAEPWLRWSYHHVLLRSHQIEAARGQLEYLRDADNEYGQRARQRLVELDELSRS